MKRNKKMCSKCNKEISLSNFERHIESCKGFIQNKFNVEQYNVNGKYICPYCKNEFCKRGIATHVISKHERINIGKQKGRRAWNKGLTKDNNEIVKKYSETMKQKYKNGEIEGGFKGKKHTEESLKKIAKSGGLRKGSGRGKKGWYKGYWSDSSWELAYIIYNLDHNIKFERNSIGFEYEYLGKKYKYFPDFILEDGSYIEIKGWLDEKNKAKISSFSGCLIVLGKNEIKNYLEYTVFKYGKDFVKLYENKLNGSIEEKN